MDAAEKDEDGGNRKRPQRKRASARKSSSSSAGIESIKKQKQEPINCNACGSKTSSDDDLAPIAGDWPSVRLCTPCNSLLKSNKICSYCFCKISSELVFNCIHCKRSVHFRCIAKKIDGGINATAAIDPRNFACFDCVPPASEPSEEGREEELAVPLSKEEEEKGLSIQQGEEKTEPRYKLRSREKGKASPVTSSPKKVERRRSPITSSPKKVERCRSPITSSPKKVERRCSPITSSPNKVERRRSLRSSGKEEAVGVPISATAVPLPDRLFSLTNCHVCGHKTKKLKVLKSDWRVLLVCGTCLVSLGADRICAYCFDPTSEKKDDFINCQKCLRAVHFRCIRNHPFYIDPEQLNADTYSCFDCEPIPNLWKNHSASNAAAAPPSRPTGEGSASTAVAPDPNE